MANDSLFVAAFTAKQLNLRFEGVGGSMREACNVLIQGLRSHANAYGQPWRWWYDNDMKAAYLAGKPDSHVEDIERLVADGVFQVREYERGGTYRNGIGFPFSEKPRFEECGCCDHYHRPGYAGDCRNDAERFSANDLDDRFGENGWTPVDLEEQKAEDEDAFGRTKDWRDGLNASRAERPAGF